MKRRLHRTIFSPQLPQMKSLVGHALPAATPATLLKARETRFRAGINQSNLLPILRKEERQTDKWGLKRAAADGHLAPFTLYSLVEWRTFGIHRLCTSDLWDFEASFLMKGCQLAFYYSLAFHGDVFNSHHRAHLLPPLPVINTMFSADLLLFLLPREWDVLNFMITRLHSDDDVAARSVTVARLSSRFYSLIF